MQSILSFIGVMIIYTIVYFYGFNHGVKAGLAIKGEGEDKHDKTNGSK